MTRPPVTLQISLAPSDYAHARHLLPHQARTWRNQVDEILITVDFHRSAGRFSARWEEGRERILPLARSIEGAQVVEVDYGPEARKRVSAAFFGGKGPVPEKDFRGGPFYTYFFGLTEATHDRVFHTDSDMFFGGGSSTWMDEAVAAYQADASLLVSAPHPGPPSPAGHLLSQTATPEPGTAHAHRFDNMSTRLFLIDRKRFREKIGSLPLRRPGFRNTAKAVIEGNPAAELPEHLFTEAMQLHGLIRREFLGTAPGMWHLHPPYRCADFYQQLPKLIERVESGDIPAEQRGIHDIHAGLVDWSEALEQLRQNRWWKRLWARLT